MRTVMVTGGASGIGRGVCAAFGATGDSVVVADVQDDAGQAVAGEAGGRFVHLDVTDADSVDAAVKTLEADGARIDVLVNSAGLTAGGGPLVDLPVSVFDTCTAVNFRGTFLMLRAVGGHMRRHGIAGAIVTISSVGARQPTPGLGHYEATKAAVDALTRSAAIELAGAGIRVNAVAPGPVLTPMTAGFASDPQARAAWESRIPLGSIAEVPDVVAAVTFLASPAARHITGVSLAVDGGQLLA